MDDPELDAIRQRRMQEIMAQQGGKEGYGGGQMTEEQRQQQQEQQQAAEERRQTMLNAVLQPAARERLNRIALVKPDKAKGVENMVLQMAQKGQLNEKISESRLISLLEQVNEQSSTKTKVTIQRRRALDDDY